MSAATFLLVRHGEAEGNREHRFIGQSDTRLSEAGHGQARAVAARLASLPITRIVSSDLRRAVETAEPLAQQLEMPVDPEPRLREISNGEWTGLLPSEIEAGWPELFARYRGGEDVPRPGGERWADVAARSVAAFEEISEQADDGDLVAIFTHAGVGLALVNWAVGFETATNFFRGPFGPLANGSITTLRTPGPGLVGVNDVGHLDQQQLPPDQLPFFR